MPQKKPARAVVSYYRYSSPKESTSTAEEDLQPHSQHLIRSKTAVSEEAPDNRKDLEIQEAGKKSKAQSPNGLLGFCADDEPGEEAEVPSPFEYFEPEDECESNRRRHTSAELPQFYTLGDVPEDLEELPPLQYYPLDPSVDPIRLLVLLPHFGNPYSTVQCNLFPVSLAQKHYCFAAVKNTRQQKSSKQHHRQLSSQIYHS